ncbi:MAG: bifunctional phosphoribosyl-AMP cyclohydrolase/phosphoribosyl-ATP diphosphatase HisIE [Gammaproteobacteria bacterium]
MSSTPGERITANDAPTLDFGKGDGLLPAVVQDADSAAVLMVGYMNEEALAETFARRRVVFFSRTKQRLWMKGETSGHVLDLVEIRTDCDRDALLVTARPNGSVCHVGTDTCFGDDLAAAASALAFLSKLEGVIEQRVAENPEGSYTARLFAKGPKRIAQKVGEEGLEVALAAVAETDDHVISESADLLYHLLVLLKSRGITLGRVVAELESRHAGK